MELLTTLDELRRQTGVLVCIDDTEAPFVSCHLDLSQGEASYRMAREDHVYALRADFEAMMDRIAAYLATALRADAQGVALFVR